jgi:hypothetical protein
VHANFCTKCGSPVIQGSRFCRGCGAPVAGAPVPNPAMGGPSGPASPSEPTASRGRSWKPYAIGGVVAIGLAAFALKDRMPSSSSTADAGTITPGLALVAPAGWHSVDTEAGQMMALAGTNLYSELPEGPRVTLRSSSYFENAEMYTGFTTSGVGAFTVLDGPTELTVASRPAMQVVVQEGDAGGLVNLDGSPRGTVTRHVIVALGDGRSALILMELPAAQYEQNRATLDAIVAGATIVP